MVEEAVENGGGDGAIAVEDGRPLLEGFVGGEDNGAAFVALAQDLEEQVGAALIDGQVAEFIEDEQSRGKIAFEFGLESAVDLSGAQGVDDIDGVGEEDAVALLAGAVAEGGGEMGFAEADQAEEDDIGFFLDEAQAEEVLDLEAIDLFGPVPAEGFEGFEDGKARGLDAAGHGAVLAREGFAFDEAVEVIEMTPVFAGGFGGGGAEVFFEVGQLEVVEAVIEGEIGGGVVNGEGGS